MKLQFSLVSSIRSVSGDCEVYQQTNSARSKLMEAGVKLVSEVVEEIFKAAYGWRLKTGRIEG